MVTLTSLLATLAIVIFGVGLVGCAGSQDNPPPAATDGPYYEELFVPELLYDMRGPTDGPDHLVTARNPLKGYENGGAVMVANFTPVLFHQVTIRFRGAVIVRDMDLPAWTRATITPRPLTALEGFADPGVAIEIPDDLNPIMIKFREMKANWSWMPKNFYEPGHSINANYNYSPTMSGAQLRGFYTMNYNMAHFISSQTFADTVCSMPVICDGPAAVYPDLNAVVDAMRSTTRVFKNWALTGKVNGLASSGSIAGTKLSLKHSALHFNEDEWSAGRLNVQTWFHEFSHCFGFEHTSNMTYGNEAAGYPSVPAAIERAMLAAWQERDGLLFPMATWKPTLPKSTN